MLGRPRWTPADFTIPIGADGPVHTSQIPVCGQCASRRLLARVASVTPTWARVAPARRIASSQRSPHRCLLKNATMRPRASRAAASLYPMRPILLISTNRNGTSSPS